MDQEKLQTIMSAFIQSQFSHCPVLWMFHDRIVSKIINKIHDRPLRVNFKDTSSKFEDTAFVTIHHRNLQLLTAENYKSEHDLNPKFMGEIFIERNISYYLKGSNCFSVPTSQADEYGLKAIRCT